MNDRAIFYRKFNEIPDNLGTAVNVQAMVFGNMGDDSGTGVGFTRNPATGEHVFYGEYLINAQGEDVVAGIRTPQPIANLAKDLPECHKQLRAITSMLEKHYRDVQDFEFTIERRKLYMLQTRTGKRTAQAAVKIAVDMTGEKLITKKEALMRVDPVQIEQLLHPVFDPKAPKKVIAKGLPASPGAATGMAVFTADVAAKRGKDGDAVILVRPETTPDDIHGMDAARGILTARGGMTSHAAVVARGMGKTCVAGCESIKVDEHAKVLTAGDIKVKEGDWISINGSTGEVMMGKIPTMEASLSGEFGTFMKWVDEFRKVGVRANADIPRDAKVARDFGAEGIGLCRTEHMFFAEDRLPHMQAMIMAKTLDERKAALAKLLPFQRSDFKGLLKEMAPYPVTIRLLDPPLHEFLPKREELMVEIAKLEAKDGSKAAIAEKKRILGIVQDLHEFNPMLGLRGCRLGILFPEITEMQARAIFEAACELRKEGVKTVPEVMVPLVGFPQELKNQADIINRVAKETMDRMKVKVEYHVGTMIEIPRAALLAGEIAKIAEFFSFGTNDLTQTTLGLSRDDAGKIIKHYVEVGLWEKDPFATLDQSGVGELVKMGVAAGRKTRKGMKIGICGEHGGDPNSVKFCAAAGLTYVSCSPYRVPVARLAAAQAALGASAYTSK
jgi:pyruvate,orthophosphate dikinase